MSQFENQQDNRSASKSFESTPQTLIERERWVCWRYEQGGDKKPPYDPETDERASIHEPETWSDFETALEAYQRRNYDGIGFILTEDGALTGFDFDDCRDPETGEIEPEVEGVIERLDSYSEISPSGTGIHTLIIGEKPEEYGSKGGAYIEVYDSARYFTVTGNHLDGTPESIESHEDEFQRVCEVYLNKTSSAEVEEVGTPDIDADDDLIEMGENALHELQEESTPVFSDVMDFLQGGVSKFDSAELLKEDGLIDVSGQEYIGISLLHSTVKRYCDESESRVREITWATWTHYCREHSITRHSQKRRWLADSDKYRSEIFNHAIAEADSDKFEMMVENKGAGTRRENNEYSQMTYGALWSALFEQLPDLMEVHNLLSSSPQPYNDMDPENPQTESRIPDGHASENPEVHELLPEKWDIVERAYEIDNGYNAKKTYEEAFRRLQSEHGEVKAARIGSSTWVYYPVHYPDPPEACTVKLYGEGHEPEDSDSMRMPTEQGEDAEPEIMTDGGVNTEVPEAKQDLERIRKAREGSDESTDSPDTFTCPIEGCSRTVIGSPDALRSHVRQSGEESHRHRRLDDALKIEFDEEAYHAEWGPQLPEDGDERRESIYEPDDLWGPGVPESEVMQS